MYPYFIPNRIHCNYGKRKREILKHGCHKCLSSLNWKLQRTALNVVNLVVQNLNEIFFYCLKK